ncbi:hypothetical protein FC770_03955 [Nocardioides jishulii]|uniref:Uncharacterized protein n=1 Tax=Nocardioides jishulii TaxID=2575440 RepID=A0A4U2YS75_9ACTN|nr:hypothetical protein FC770_03955 [Nocardioides jishulii]
MPGVGVRRTPRDVFGLKDVPPAQAIVLTAAEGESATVFVAEDLAEAAQDPELAALVRGFRRQARR